MLSAVTMCVGDVLSPTIHLMFVGLKRQFVMAVNRRGTSSGRVEDNMLGMYSAERQNNKTKPVVVSVSLERSIAR